MWDGRRSGQRCRDGTKVSNRRVENCLVSCMYASAVQSANDGSALSAPSEHRGIASSSSAGSQERQTNHRNSAKKPWSTCARVRRRVSGVHRLLISMRNALGVIGEVGRHARVAGRNWHPRCDPRHLQSILDSSCATRVARRSLSITRRATPGRRSSRNGDATNQRQSL